MKLSLISFSTSFLSMISHLRCITFDPRARIFSIARESVDDSLATAAREAITMLCIASERNDDNAAMRGIN